MKPNQILPICWGLLLFSPLFLTSCSPAQSSAIIQTEQNSNDSDENRLPEFTPLKLNGRKLKVVATTNIIGDVVGNIGRDSIELTTLLSLNQDPHRYEATPRDLVALEEADVIIVNGWDLEEQLASTIRENFSHKMVTISAYIEPLALSEDSEHDSSHDLAHDLATDPHVWLSVRNVRQWSQNVEQVLHELDPANSAVYAANLEDYLAQLTVLEQEVDTLLAGVPNENRKLVTNHDALGYFAADYGFEIIGTVIPAASTSSEPSAIDLVQLVELMKSEEICTLFAETTQNQTLAQTVSAELDGCESVQVLNLYTGSLGEGNASSYVGMYLSNVNTIVNGLKSQK